MGIVTFQDVHFEYDARTVVHELTWTIQRGEKIGLVGPNGAGKTTLFRLILGQLKPQIGTVTRSRGLQIGYLPQEPELDTSNTLFAEVSSTFDNLRRLEERVAEVAQLIAEHHETDQADDLMEEYDELQARLESAGGYDYEVLVSEVLGGLGFSTADYDLPISALSGGQKCRAALARLLLQEADLLLLDEPTNHLDIEATRFLERFLAGYHGSVILISHDRFLLDRVVDKIADLEDQRVTVYPCGYSDFIETKRIRQLTAEREFAKQQEWLRKQQDFIDRNRANAATARRARGRARLLDRLHESGRILDRPKQFKRKMAIDFAPPPRRNVDRVLVAENVRKAFGETVLFDELEFTIYRGEKVGIIGPNGVGKTTLLKMAVGLIPPDSGRIAFNEKLQVGYYDQEHSGLNEANRIIDEIEPGVTGPREGEIRSFLARFLFRGDDVYKRVGDLSGGEQSRVSLAKLVWQNPHVLVLDEPTNHLDIPAREVLEEALLAFEGAIVLVSHDRYFLDRVVNRLLVLPRRGEHELMSGNWSSYEEIASMREAAERAAAEIARGTERRSRKGSAARQRPPAGGPAAPVSPYARWSIERLEAEIIEREEKLAGVEAQFADPNVCRDPEKVKSLQAEAAALRTELTALNTEWETRAAEA